MSTRAEPGTARATVSPRSRLKARVDAPEASEFVDEDAEPDTTYTYEVIIWPKASASCSADVTAISFFPNPVVATLATVGVAGTVFALRRKA